jgi:hypothetical protein
MAINSSARTAVKGSAILLLVVHAVACRGDGRGDTSRVVQLASGFLPAPDNLTVEFLADRRVRVSWTNRAFYTTVYVTRTADASQSVACAPPTPDGFQPGSAGTCTLPAPTGVQPNTIVSFDVAGCDAQVTQLCSPSSNPVSVFARRPQAPTLTSVTREGDSTTVRISFTNNESFFEVPTVFVGFPDDSASVACSPQKPDCIWTVPARHFDFFVAVACDKVLCSDPSSPPVGVITLPCPGPAGCDAGRPDR